MASLLPDDSDRLLDGVVPAHREWLAAHPGEPDRRQPVHTVYGGAHLFRADTARRLGDLALRSLLEHGGEPADFAGAIGLDPALAETVHARVVAKLESEPVEDFRIDFEDGFGVRSDKEEDDASEGAAREVARGLAGGTLPPFLGIRVKPFTAEFAGRAARTLDRFLGTLLEETGGALPPNFVVTNPKVVLPEQAAALADLFDVIEERSALPAGALKMELMVETPASIFGPAGEAALPALVRAAQGRCVAAHFGVYDYTALLGITAIHQDLDHPACDFARHVMQVALSGSGVWLSDGATNVLPAPPHRAPDGGQLSSERAAENLAAVHSAWALHYRHVRHSLRHAYYQGWDLHPAQLPTRYAAVYAFYLEALPGATERLRRFVESSARATLTGDVFDDAATGQALLNFFLRGLGCGAVTEAEVEATGLSREEIASRSFSTILRGRAPR
ncbi:MAG TPA: phosphoenolpyruvate kinase [Gemmatimonadota bacterium]|nr:phosphoenolpyruvate kinase [Gemmatimonadota bacterium]